METLRFPDDIGEYPVSGSRAPLVSVVVPVYNTPAAQLERCLDSLYEQTYENIEIIVVDDGSNTSNLKNTRRLIARDSRARLVEAGHRGVSNARNAGMDECNGEWLAFADSDDEVERSFIQDALVIALSTGVDLVCGAVSSLFQGEKPKEIPSVCMATVVSDVEETRFLALQMLGHVKYKYFTCPDFQGRGPVAKLYRADIARTLKFDESITIGEDTLFNYRFIECCTGVAVIEKTWYWYYQNQQSAMHSPKLSKWTGSIDGLLAACSTDEDPTPFLSRCAFLAMQGVTCFLESGGSNSARDAISLLDYAFRKGCFSNPSFKGYKLSPWLRAMVRLCSHRLFRFAIVFWRTKIWLGDLVRHRGSLIDAD